MTAFKDRVDSLLGVAIPTFGEQVEYRPAAGGKFTMQAVFDRTFKQVDPDSETLVSVTAPRIGVRLRDIPRKPLKGDQVRIKNETFRVDEIQEDGQGGAIIWLKDLALVGTA